MKFMFCCGILSTLVMFCCCQSQTLIVNVIEVESTEDVKFVCTTPSSTHLTRWTYLAGSTGTSLMSYLNGQCTMSPSDSFLSDSSRYSYTCNNTAFQVVIKRSVSDAQINNHILACRNALKPDETGLTWIIKLKSGTMCTYCEPTMTFKIKEITEEDNVTFLCRVSSDVSYVNWNKNMGSKTAAMGVYQNGQCETSPGTTFLENTSQYDYTCNKTVYQVTRLNVQRSEHNDMYMCTPVKLTEGKESNWIIKVKAQVSFVILTAANSPNNITENIAVWFTCKTSTARPAASLYWYRHPNGNSNDVTRIVDNITRATDYNDLSVITSTLNFVPTRQHNGMKIYCEANNSVNTSPKKSTKILLNVQYKAEHPYIAKGREYRVVENTPGALSCTVRGGNPTPTLSWSCTNFSSTNQSTINYNGNTTKTLTWTPTKAHEGKCTCTSTQTNFKTETKDVLIVVLYPPSKPEFKVNGTSIVGNISFIEGTTRSITCTADSNPSPDRYTWTGPSHIDSPNQSILTFNTVEKKDAGKYTCIVNNTMNISDGAPVKRFNSSTANLVVLYGPFALSIDKTSKLKGEKLTINCPYKPGMPAETSFVWTRNVDDKQWDSEQLYIQHIEKSDDANYSCYISNSMKPSGESIVYIGNDTQSFHLNVLYEANVTSFKIDGIANTTVTKNESEPVQFICNADSNPTANMTLYFNNQSLKTAVSNNVNHNISEASCLDGGTYICTAKNIYNKKSIISKEVQLFVNCYPRIAYTEVRQNITSEKNGTITITLDVVAYPPPTFIWYKLTEENWTQLNDNDNYSISYSDVQSNLTIRSVGTSDFTSYKVHTKNEFGQMDQFYYLSPYDKPDPPINFNHIEGRTTTSSIHLVWTPGFDNGPPQTFNVKYKRSSDNVWNYRNVSDNGESTMDLLLTGLTENTKYEFVIFASNVKGNSSEISFTATTLKAIDNSSKSPGALIGGITGGISGVIIIVVVIIVIIRRYPLLKGRGNADQEIRRPDSDDSDDEDGLVDNPMYASSSNVAPVASTSASTSTDIYAKPVKPKKPIVPGKGDVYAVVDKTKKLDRDKNGKTTPGNSKKQEADVYENFEIDNKPKEKENGKHSSSGEPASKQPKLNIVNKDGLIYADLLFNGKPPGEKMVIIGDDPTPYSQVDFTKKADPLPESDDEEETK